MRGGVRALGSALRPVTAGVRRIGGSRGLTLIGWHRVDEVSEGESHRLEGEEALRDEHDSASIDPVGEGPGPGSEHQQRPELQGGEHSDRRGRSGESVDDDRERGVLDPRPELRDEQASEEEARVSVPERAEGGGPSDGRPSGGVSHGSGPAQSSSLRAEMNTSPGTSTRPIAFIFFLPSFCFSSSFRFRVMSPP